MKNIFLGLLAAPLLLAAGENMSPRLGEGKAGFKSGMCTMAPPNEVGAGTVAKVRVLFFVYPNKPPLEIRPSELALWNEKELLINPLIDQVLDSSDGPVFMASRPPTRTMLQFTSQKFGGSNDKSDQWAVVANGPAAEENMSVTWIGPCTFKLFRDQESARNNVLKLYNQIRRAAK